MNKSDVVSVQKSVRDALKDISIFRFLETYAIVSIMSVIAIVTMPMFLQMIYSHFNGFAVDDQTALFVLSIVILSPVAIFMLHYLAIFEILRESEMRRFEIYKCAKLVISYIIMLLLYSISNLIVTHAIITFGNVDPVAFFGTLIRKYSFYSILSAPFIVALISNAIGFFVLMIIFYGPIIQYIDNGGILSSFKKSASLFLNHPVPASLGIITSFVLFVIPSMISILPFIFIMSPTLAIFFDPFPVFIPLSVVPVTIGMSFGLILMYAFLAKYYKNELKSRLEQM